MKTAVNASVDELWRCILNINESLRRGNKIFDLQIVEKFNRLINLVLIDVEQEYSFYASKLREIKDNLFVVNGLVVLNVASFGELYVIVQHLYLEPVNIQFWHNIHPAIIVASRELYKDGHFASSAEKALREVEGRLREKFGELKPESFVPVKTIDIINALFSENGLFKFCDISTANGKSYRKGVHLLFEGAMAAYRNPASHINLKCSKREAIEQIILASQLMYVLDKENIN